MPGKKRKVEVTENKPVSGKDEESNVNRSENASGPEVLPIIPTEDKFSLLLSLVSYFSEIKEETLEKTKISVKPKKNSKSKRVNLIAHQFGEDKLSTLQNIIKSRDSIVELKEKYRKLTFDIREQEKTNVKLISEENKERLNPISDERNQELNQLSRERIKKLNESKQEKKSLLLQIIKKRIEQRKISSETRYFSTLSPSLLELSTEKILNTWTDKEVDDATNYSIDYLEILAGVNNFSIESENTYRDKYDYWEDIIKRICSLSFETKLPRDDFHSIFRNLTPLILIIQSGNLNLLAKYIKAGLSVLKENLKKISEGRDLELMFHNLKVRLLGHAIEYGHHHIVMFLLNKNFPVYPQAYSYIIDTIKINELFIPQIEQIINQDSTKSTIMTHLGLKAPMYLAIQKGSKAISNSLMAAGYFPRNIDDLTISNVFDWPLLIATKHCSTAILAMFIQQQLNINPTSSKENISLLSVAALIKKSSFLNEDAQTSFEIEKNELITSILDQGALLDPPVFQHSPELTTLDINKQIMLCLQPLHAAVLGSNTKLIGHLLDKGISSLHSLKWYIKSDLISQIAEFKGELKSRNIAGVQDNIDICGNNFLQLILNMALLYQEFLPKKHTKDKSYLEISFTPLHIAISVGNEEIIKHLLNYANGLDTSYFLLAYNKKILLQLFSKIYDMVAKITKDFFNFVQNLDPFVKVRMEDTGDKSTESLALATAIKNKDLNKVKELIENNIEIEYEEHVVPMVTEWPQLVLVFANCLLRRYKSYESKLVQSINELSEKKKQILNNNPGSFFTSSQNTNNDPNRNNTISPMDLDNLNPPKSPKTP